MVTRGFLAVLEGFDRAALDVGASPKNVPNLLRGFGAGSASTTLRRPCSFRLVSSMFVLWSASISSRASATLSAPCI